MKKLGNKHRSGAGDSASCGSAARGAKPRTLVEGSMRSLSPLCAHLFGTPLYTPRHQCFLAADPINTASRKAPASSLVLTVFAPTTGLCWSRRSGPSVPSIDRPGKEASASTSGASSAAEDVGTCIGVCESKTTEGPSGSPNRALLR